ncbi:hypothetical protein HMPREF0201_01389 [Cedecea davisae DSM 4568]|uniref:Uncharacterized protein n=1 Tax=Cedecea davisae DSM 4568 TaxID=566551 RepID=S3IYD8_9ENTR|nr:hypothetical protein HMPREF0201_01389 [Cedecea davisae DSM 4568]
MDIHSGTDDFNKIIAVINGDFKEYDGCLNAFNKSVKNFMQSI